MDTKEISGSYIQREIDFLKAATDEIADMPCIDYPQYTEEEVNAIIAKEKDKVEKNYNAFVRNFHHKNTYNTETEQRDYILLFSFPGAGKTRLSQYVHEQMLMKNPKNVFNILDKDEYRFLFPHLHQYLRNHIDENGKFEYPATNCIRTFLDATLQTGSRSILASGSLGAATDFPQNAEKAIDIGYHPHVIYLSVNKDVANLSNIYRSAGIFNKIIDDNEPLCPRLIPVAYYDSFDQQKYHVLRNLSRYQKQHGQAFEISVTNRNFDTLYNSALTPDRDICQIVRQEEQRMFTFEELKNIRLQVYTIKQNMKKRIEHGVYVPNTKEQHNTLATLNNLQQHMAMYQNQGLIFVPAYLSKKFFSR